MGIDQSRFRVSIVKHPMAKIVNWGVNIMDVAKILSDLRMEREQIEEAILSLERLARGRGRRRGRPPAWMAPLAKKRGRPAGTKNKLPVVAKSAAA